MAYPGVSPRRLPVLKEIDSASAIAWSVAGSDSSLLAAGNVQGTLDENFQTTARLELYSTDLSIDGKQPYYLGSVAVAQCNFSKLAWGSKGISDGSHPYGILAGGMSTGSLHLWDAGKIPESPESALLARVDKHQGPILGIDFNPSQPNLLATSSTDGEVLIWDLMKISAPTQSKPSAESHGFSRFGVSAVSWNTQVPYILASSTSNGETFVWDLRQKRAIINFQDSSRAHTPITSLAWDPQQARQLVVCYSNPTPEIWDLRNSMTPKCILQGGHTKGILSVRWNPHDSRFFATSGDDCITSLWSNEGHLLHQIQHEGVPFEFEWNNQVPGMFATSLYAGKIQVKNVHYTGPFIVPSWLGESSGASFGFGGKMTAFSKAGQGNVSITKVSSENQFVDLYRNFQILLQSRGYEEICDDKVSQLQNYNDEEAKTWEFIKLLFFDSSPLRFRDFLGFGSSPSHLSATAKVDESPQDAESFFQNISRTEKSEHKNISSSPLRSAAITDSDEIDEAIKFHLLVGDYSAAVSKCFESNRLADALLLASLGGQELWSSAQERFISSHPKSYIRNLVQGVINRNFAGIVKESKLPNWQETLSFLITNTSGQEFVDLSNSLSQRLGQNNLKFPAVVCALAASNIDLAMSIWMSADEGNVGGASKLHYAIEKLFLLSQALKKHGYTQTQKTSQYFSEYAGLLASQGYLHEAVQFLDLTNSGYSGGHETSQEQNELLHRIRFALEGPSQPIHAAVSDRVSSRPEISRAHPRGAGIRTGVVRRGAPVRGPPVRAVSEERPGTPVPGPIRSSPHILRGVTDRPIAPISSPQVPAQPSVAPTPRGLPGRAIRVVPRGRPRHPVSSTQPSPSGPPMPALPTVAMNPPAASALPTPPSRPSLPSQPITTPVPVARSIQAGVSPAGRRPLRTGPSPRAAVRAPANVISRPNVTTPQAQPAPTQPAIQSVQFPSQVMDSSPSPLPSIQPRQIGTQPASHPRQAPQASPLQPLHHSPVPGIRSARPIRRAPSRPGPAEMSTPPIPEQPASAGQNFNLQSTATNFDVSRQSQHPSATSLPTSSPGIVQPVPIKPRSGLSNPQRAPTTLSRGPLPTRNTPQLAQHHNTSAATSTQISQTGPTTNSASKMQSSGLMSTPAIGRAAQRTSTISPISNSNPEAFSSGNEDFQPQESFSKQVLNSQQILPEQVNTYQHTQFDESFKAPDQSFQEPENLNNVSEEESLTETEFKESHVETSSEKFQVPEDSTRNYSPSPSRQTPLSSFHTIMNDDVAQVDPQIPEEGEPLSEIPTHEAASPMHAASITNAPPTRDVRGVRRAARPIRGGASAPRRGPPIPSRTSSSISAANKDSVSSSNLNPDVSGKHADLVTNLRKILDFFGAQKMSSMDERMYQDAVKRFASLSQQLESSELSDSTISYLKDLLNAMTSGDTTSAGKIQVDMIQNSWNEARNWLPGFKNLITLMKKYPMQ